MARNNFLFSLACRLSSHTVPPSIDQVLLVRLEARNFCATLTVCVSVTLSPLLAATNARADSRTSHLAAALVERAEVCLADSFGCFEGGGCGGAKCQEALVAGLCVLAAIDLCACNAFSALRLSSPQRRRLKTVKLERTIAPPTDCRARKCLRQAALACWS